MDLCGLSNFKMEKAGETVCLNECESARLMTRIYERQYDELQCYSFPRLEK